MDYFVFILSAVIVAYVGTRMTTLADRLADRTGIGEAFFGAIALGATTSISGSVLSMASAYEGLTDLAVSNAIGGIAAQTFFLVLADISYRKANLEHAAASLSNIMLSILLICLLCIPIVATQMPATTWWGIHPATLFLFCFYLFGLRYCQEQKQHPMWFPRSTKHTVEDTPDEEQGGPVLKALVIKFLLFMVVLVGAGFAIKESGVHLAQSWGISHSLLGALLTATITSLPELITTFAAVRRGALTLAVGGIVGGNTFDVLFLAFSDITYTEGSIYHAMSATHISYISLIILMTAILAMGLLRRERQGVGGIGRESLTIGLLYVLSLYLMI